MMTNQEAIASLRTLCNTCKLFPRCAYKKPECFQAIEMAISALQAQDLQPTCNKPATDTISRQAIINSFRYDDDGTALDMDDIVYRLEQFPSAQPASCEDAVSRKDVIDLYKRGAERIANAKGISVEELPHNGLDVLMNLPSVTPKRKTGKWVNNIHDLPVCDQCGYMTLYDRAIDDYEYGNYCPNCGADMRGEIDDI